MLRMLNFKIIKATDYYANFKMSLPSRVNVGLESRYCRHRKGVGFIMLSLQFIEVKI